MTFTVCMGDLFLAPQGYYLAHCISGDYALGAGIAKQFEAVYSMRRKLCKKYPVYIGKEYQQIGKALLVDNVFNLVTKSCYYMKPTYDTLIAALMDMKRQCLKEDITNIAMPRIGCGLDGLSWDKVQEYIQVTFSDTDINIRIYEKF